MFKLTGRLAARGVAFLWGGWWAYFSLAVTLSEPGTFGQRLLVCLIALPLFLGSAFVPWWKERAGGALLLAEGLALCVANFTFFHNPPATQLFLLLTLALPPLLAGILFLTARPQPCQPA